MRRHAHMRDYIRERVNHELPLHLDRLNVELPAMRLHLHAAPPRPTQATAKKLPGSQAPLSRTRRHDQTHHDVLRHPAMRRVQAKAEDAQSVVSVSGEENRRQPTIRAMT